MLLISFLYIFYVRVYTYKYCSMLVLYVFLCLVSSYKNSSTFLFPGIFTTNQEDRYSDHTTVLPLLRFLPYDPSRGFESTLFSMNVSSRSLSTCAFVSYFTFYSLSTLFSILCSIPQSFTLTEELRSLSVCQLSSTL